MRGIKGKLVCTWSPALHGAGCSTVACSIGFGMQYYSDRRILIVNKGNSLSSMEKYLAGDIEIKYSMDNLKIFNTSIRAEHIMTYSTQVNKGLYVIAGSRFKRDITKEDKDFDRLFLEESLKCFDMVVADIDTGVREGNRLFLEQADAVAAVFTPNEIMLDELCSCGGGNEACDILKNEKTICIINKLYEGWDTSSVIGRYRSRYSLPSVFGLNYDGEVLDSCCTDRNFYSFLSRELKTGKSEYVRQLSDICGFLAGRLGMPIYTEGNLKEAGIFKRFFKAASFDRSVGHWSLKST